MSKKTFIEGFRKAAEAAGIDPVQLAKIAASSDGDEALRPIPKYKTEGWAPPPVVAVGTKAAPEYGYDDTPPGDEKREAGTLYERAEPIGSPDNLKDAWGMLTGSSDIPDATDFSKIIHSRAAIDPTYSAWLGAHTDTIEDIASKVLPYYEGLSSEALSYKNPTLAESIAKAYHSGMLNRTGMVSRVSMPANAMDAKE